MPLMSMTGFARTDGRHGPWRWQIEAKSVNGKALDARLRLPPGLEALEADMRERVARRFRRGNIQIMLDLACDTPATTARINEPLLRELATAARRLADEVGSPPPAIDTLLSVKGVVDIVETTTDEAALADRNAALLASFDRLLDALAENRRAEGTRLQSVLASAVDRIEALTGQARNSPARTPDAVKQRLAEQVARLLEDAGLDADRLHQEALLLAVRDDVQEEIDRLTAHIENARELLFSEEAVGRKLDFLAQEFNREANTLCSKASDRELSRIGLDLKAVIDQFREQVQNVE
jgi:uncharacterized protein (TIGR00255 family)